jgi:branched-subunit amino acid aminotransferase/4-amino-4-deoxychorismate lyase
LVDRNGNITEGTRTNFFVMKDSTIISPPEEDILLGVTRKHVLEVALKNGFSVEHEPVRLSNIAAYDCAFLTSTSTKIVPITSADTTSLRPASAALQRLMSLYDAFHDAAE